ncbi:uncharacterized protein LOC118683958 [Molothrus ater]|uniref:uncharacterized protein LOC118683958 n=1 Tax=Molothrus ater TaxID=84834 RepID=UPI00174E48D2|nr:uncharacterized protein LOC118683958 [Molothrus ater]
MQGKSLARRTETHVQIHTSAAPLCVFPARPSRRAVGGAQARAPPPAVGRAPPSPQRTPPAAPARTAPALPYWFPRSRAGRPLVRTEQGAARGGAPEQSVIGRRRAPTFPPVPPRGAPASGARRRPAVRAGGGRSPGGRSRHRGRGPGWGQRRHTRRLPPWGKGSEAKRSGDPAGSGLRGRRPALPAAPLRFPAAAPPTPRGAGIPPAFSSSVTAATRYMQPPRPAPAPGRERRHKRLHGAGPALPTGSRRFLSLPRLPSPACPAKGRSYSPPQQLQSHTATQPLQPLPQPDLPPAVPPIGGYLPHVPQGSPCRTTPGDSLRPSRPDPRDARFAHRRSRTRP